MFDSLVWVYVVKILCPAGCGFQFSSDTEVDDPLEVLKEGDQRAVVLPSKNCTINESTSMYLECGTWRPIDKMSVLNTFRLNQSCMDSPILKASDLILPRVHKEEEFTQILAARLPSDLIVYHLEPKTVREQKADTAIWHINYVIYI